MPDALPPSRLGRPRAVPRADDAPAPRDQILHAAAELFITLGFTATTTRAIAERAGMRQASMYYHFGGKEEMLTELLNASLYPGIEIAHRIEALVPQEFSPAAALHALVTVDSTALLRTPLNLAFLWLLPEVQGEQYARFHSEGRRFQDVFARLGTAAASRSVASTVSEEQLGAVLNHLSELIALLRRSAGATDPAFVDIVATSCLRVCGLGDAEIAAATAESVRLRAVIESEEPAPA